MISKGLVLMGVTMPGVADDGAIDMLQMPAQLMAATGFRKELHVGIACRFVSSGWEGQLHARQGLKACGGFLGLVAFRFGAAIEEFSQGVVNRSRIGRVSAGDSFVAFRKATFFETPFHLGERFVV